MARREGFYSLNKAAKLLCKALAVFGPGIRARYPSYTALIAALDAAEAACAALRLALNEVYAYPEDPSILI